MKKYVDKVGLQEFATKLHAKQKTIFADISVEDDVAALYAAVGSPLVASLVADMTDTTKIYVYIGSETGYINGNWYYYDGSNWVSGGVYNSTAFTTDTTLSVSGAAADAKTTGNILKIQNQTDSGNLLSFADVYNATVNGITFTNKKNGIISATGTSTNTAYYNFYFNASEMPDWLEAGKSYRLSMITDEPNILFRIYYYVSGSQSILINTSQGIVFTIPATATGLLVRLVIESGKTVNTTIKCILTKDEYFTVDEINPVIKDPYINLLGLCDVRDVTRNGVTFSANNDNSITVSGTATDTAYVDYFSSVTQLPPGFVVGKKYVLSHRSANVLFRIYAYTNNSSSNVTSLISSDADGVFTIPSDTTGLLVRLAIESGTNVSETVNPIIQLYNDVEECIYPEYDIINDLPSQIGGWQDFEVVGDELWFTTSSSDDHSTFNGTIIRIDANTHSYIGTWTHNLGHLNSIDYDADNDCIICGNASTDSTLVPHVFIFQNISEWDELSQIDFNSVDVVDLNLSSLVLLYGTMPYCNACWGEKKINDRKRYVYVNAETSRKWLKLSVDTSNDEYANTFSVIWYKTSYNDEIDDVDTAQVTQGMKMYKGNILASISHNPFTAAIFGITSSEHLKRKILRIDGTGLANANEGCTILDGEILLGASSNQAIVKIKDL